TYVKNINKKFKLKKHPLKTGRDYTSRDAVSALWREKTGKPFSYAIEHAFIGRRLSTEERYLHGVEKVYRGPGKPKMKLYADQLIGTYEKVKETVEKNAIGNIDLAYYRVALSPLPRKEHAFPTPHREAGELPFYLMTYKRMYRNQSGNTSHNPILNRLGDSDENFILINTRTAKEMGVADDDRLVIETRIGEAEGKARLSQGIRPDVVAVSYHYGQWSPTFPKAARKGTWINPVLELHPDVTSGMNSFNDTKCRVRKA
ncbi:MAG TPA: molybdopterin oxidoreductase, partial [Chromatiaceae bacterium]|nr:molybdopterin oxidoreductase [Chromatiaceae bacterium]